jgi:hypothetical protein
MHRLKNANAGSITHYLRFRHGGLLRDATFAAQTIFALPTTNWLLLIILL